MEREITLRKGMKWGANMTKKRDNFFKVVPEILTLFMATEGPTAWNDVTGESTVTVDIAVPKRIADLFALWFEVVEKESGNPQAIYYVKMLTFTKLVVSGLQKFATTINVKDILESMLKQAEGDPELHATTVELFRIIEKGKPNDRQGG